jgi:hypothetical protein
MKEISLILAVGFITLASCNLHGDDNQPPADGQVIPMPSEPNNAGPVSLLCASWLGGSGDDEITGVGIANDGTIFLAGNGPGLKFPGVVPVALDSASSGSDLAGDASNFLVQLSGDGQKVIGLSQFSQGNVRIKKLKMAEAGIYLLGDSQNQLQLAGASGSGTFIAQLAPDGKQVKWAFFHPDMMDFGVDSNAEVVVLTKGHMLRFRPGTNDPLWQVDMPSHGDNRPGGMALSPQTGIAAAVGYGMTRTGHEPYKDPYAYGFDRDGKQLWALWNPDPTKEVDAKYGGNGLMADTTGVYCGTDDQGSLYLGLRADGGNTVTAHDPLDPSNPLDSSVFQGVFQGGPGYGFHGASMTSVIFRADAKTGTLQKGTYMCAWLTPANANSLMIAGAIGVGAYQFVIGGSAFGFKAMDPWYEAPKGGYKGDGFLAVFDRDFKMVQAGYFPGSDIKCVDARNGLVVIGGSATEIAKGSDKSVPNAPEITYAVPCYKPIQPAYGGGQKDGYFAIFRVTH